MSTVPGSSVCAVQAPVLSRFATQSMWSRPSNRNARPRRVFWITDNGFSHRGQAAIERLRHWHSNAVLVHTPIHARWLNQVEIYFSILQQGALTPNDFANREEPESRIIRFQSLYETTAVPFEWKSTRKDLKAVLAKLSAQENEHKLAA
jgi:hypothetical protein